MRVRASALRDMPVITDTGIRLGRVYDILVEKSNGEVLAFVIEPEEGLDVRPFKVLETGLILIPARAFKSLGDYVIVDSRKL